MSEQPPKPPDPKRPDTGKLRSPIRPSMPTDDATTQPRRGLIAKGEALSKAAQESDDPDKLPDNPQMALAMLRRKMEEVAMEFSQGKINRAQFNAIYGRFGEQRTIIEKLIQRDPNNPAWKQAAATGHTTFLRQHFEARLAYYVIYQHNKPTALLMGGKQQPNIEQVTSVLTALWNLPNRPKVGLARKSLGSSQWLVMALGEHAVTLAVYQLEPSVTQTNLVRDLHNDFERANRRALISGTHSLDRFVFPQRALAEGNLS